MSFEITVEQALRSADCGRATQDDAASLAGEVRRLREAVAYWQRLVDNARTDLQQARVTLAQREAALDQMVTTVREKWEAMTVCDRTDEELDGPCLLIPKDRANAFDAWLDEQQKARE